MSHTDSFIEEVTEEVRRDRLFQLMRRYGWIAVLAILLLVGGAAWNEWRKAEARQAAEAYGDALTAALEAPDSAARRDALEAVTPPEGGAVVRDMLAAGELAQDDPATASARLLAVAESQELPPIYRQIALIKAVSIPGSGLSLEERAMRLEAVTPVSGLIRLLIDEQRAYLEIESGQTEAALALLTAIAADAEATAGLRQRASQVMLALGAEPGSDGGAAAGDQSGEQTPAEAAAAAD